MAERPLTQKQDNFLQKYLECGNASDAYRFAYQADNMKRAAINKAAAALLQHPVISGRVKKHRSEMAEKVGYGRKELFQDFVDIATADPNELIQGRQECCHFCHGEDHKYQWSEHEFAEAKELAGAGKRPEPQIEGGFGYNPNIPPHKECPACHGNGNFRPQIMDTRYLSPAAKKLYRGIKVTKDGFQVLMGDQDGARQMIGRMLGVYDQKVTLKNETPPASPDDIKNLSPADASKAYAAVMGSE